MGAFFIYAVFSLAATQIPIRKTTTPIAAAEKGTENTDANTTLDTRKYKAALGALYQILLESTQELPLLGRRLESTVTELG